jgi:hypothetical protein
MLCRGTFIAALNNSRCTPDSAVFDRPSTVLAAGSLLSLYQLAVAGVGCYNMLYGPTTIRLLLSSAGSRCGNQDVLSTRAECVSGLCAASGLCMSVSTPKFRHCPCIQSVGVVCCRFYRMWSICLCC